MKNEVLTFFIFHFPLLMFNLFRQLVILKKELVYQLIG